MKEIKNPGHVKPLSRMFLESEIVDVLEKLKCEGCNKTSCDIEWTIEEIAEKLGIDLSTKD